MSVPKLLPPFSNDGFLAPGDYTPTLAELRESILVRGPDELSEIPARDLEWRLYIVEDLGVLFRQLWQVGITNIFVDGSFVEDKCHPNDIDGYFDCGLH